MSHNPLFSIIMANYNNGRYIGEAIDSVLDQTYKNWELIIVDDCSTDNSLDVVGKYAKSDNRIKIVKSSINGGEGYAKRLGAEESSGELLAYFDSDDRLRPNALQVMVTAHIDHPEWVLAGSKYIELRNKNDLTIYQSPVGPQPDDPDDYLLSHPNKIVAFTVYKKDAYDKTSGFDSGLRSVADKDIYLKLEEVGGEHCIGFVDEILYEYRQDNLNSLSLGTKEKVLKCQDDRAIVYLRAYERRYKAASARYKKYEKQYADKMYEELCQIGLSKRRNLMEADVWHYTLLYLKMNKYSTKSIKRAIKLALWKYK